MATRWQRLGTIPPLALLDSCVRRSGLGPALRDQPGVGEKTGQVSSGVSSEVGEVSSEARRTSSRRKW